MNDNIRDEETKYLKQTYASLVSTHTTLLNFLEETRSNGKYMMNHITEDIKLNVDGISNKLDTFAQVEMKNREIDQFNIKIRTGELNLDKIERLMESPYFGKVNVSFSEDEQGVPFYIGVHGFADSTNEALIYDWRSPIAELFYNNELGISSYQVRNEKIDVNIDVRRQFVIERDQLLSCFDTMISIQDDVLLNALSQDGTDKMKDITATIQKEQNQIIRDIEHPYLLVNGVAGSGKTSVVMQRIAYLLYVLKDTLVSEDVLILSPNKAFIQYISDVLPALGEKNPRNFTYLQLLKNILKVELESEQSYFNRISSEKCPEDMSILRSDSYVSFLKENMSQTFDSEQLFKAVSLRGQTIISKERIIQLFDETPKVLNHRDRIQGVKERMLNEWENRLVKQSRTKRIQDEVLSLTEEQQAQYFGHLIEDDSEKSIIRYAEKLLRKKYSSIVSIIKNYRWIDRKYMFETLYAQFSMQPYKGLATPLNADEATGLLLIHHLYIESKANPRLKFVLVDEVQDYTPTQMALLLELFPNSEFTLVGDENQAIFNSAISFEHINRIFLNANKSIQNYHLLTSYRSSGAITKAFNRLASAQSAEIVPVREQGVPPVIYHKPNVESFVELVQSLLEKIKGEELTILVKSEAEISDLQNQLSDCDQVNVKSIQLAKGLEFDHVLVYDVSESRYHTKRDQKLLYTAFSRAMNQLFVHYASTPSEWIKTMI